MCIKIIKNLQFNVKASYSKAYPDKNSEIIQKYK